jgi:hypothetical protein
VFKFSIAGLAMAVIHLAIVGYTITLITGAHEPDWRVYWVMFLALDFPVSLASVPLVWIAQPSPAGPLSDFTNFWWPLAIHGVLGTLWWYIVGMSIAQRLTRFRQGTQDSPEEGHGDGQD